MSLLPILQLLARPRLHADRRVGYTHGDALELAAPHRVVPQASGLRTPPTSMRTSATTSPALPNRVELTIEMKAMVIFNVEIDIHINIAKGARAAWRELITVQRVRCGMHYRKSNNIPLLRDFGKNLSAETCRLEVHR